MSDVVFNLKFTTKKEAKKEKLIFSNKIDYIARKEATKNKEEHFKEELDEGYISRENAKVNHPYYFGKQKKSDDILYYSSEYGCIAKENIVERSLITQKINEIQNKKKACLYSSSISFTPEFSDENIKGKFTEEKFYENLEPLVKQMLVENDFVVENTMYFMAVHTNKENLHVHLEFLEKIPTRRKNKLKEETLEKFRGDVNFALDEKLKESYSSKVRDLGIKKINFRNQAKKINSLENLDYKKAIELYNNNRCRYYGDIKSKKLKKEIDRIANNVLNDEDFEKPMNDLNKLLIELDQMNEKVYKSKDRKQSYNQKEEIELMLKNQILNNIKILSSEKFDEIDKKEIITKRNRVISINLNAKIQSALRKSQRKKEFEYKRIKNLDYELNVERGIDESV